MALSTALSSIHCADRPYAPRACLRMSLQLEDLVSYTGARKAPMKRLLFAVLVAAIPALQLHAPERALPADRLAPATSKPAPVASHAPAAPVFGAAEQNAMVKQYCTGCHNDRAKAGQLSLAAFDASNAAESRARRHHRKDDPQAARRHDAARERAPAGGRADQGAGRSRSSRAIDRAALDQSQSRIASVPAAQSRRVRRAP